MKATDFKLGDTIDIRAPDYHDYQQRWYKAVVSDIGKTILGTTWIDYIMSPAVHSDTDASGWISGTWQEIQDMRFENIRFHTEEKKKRFRLSYNHKDAYYFLEEIK